MSRLIVVLSISMFCSRFPVGRSGKSGDSSIKIFHRNKQQNKKIKKRCFFLPAMIADGSQGFLQKNTTPEGWRFFSKNPKGLTLTD